MFGKTASELILKSKAEAILGPESSFQARSIIELVEKAEVSIISFAPTISTFSYLKSPYLFRVAYNHSSQIYAICDIVKAFGWKQVVTIYQDDEFGNWIVTDLIHALQVCYPKAKLIDCSRSKFNILSILKLCLCIYV